MTLLLLLLGCPHPGPLESPVARIWAPPPAEATYVRVAVAGPVDLPPVPFKVSWSVPTLVDGRVVVDVVEWDMSGPEPEAREQIRHFYGPEGFGYLGTVDDSGALVRWDPPQVVLPPRPAVGDTWSATHTKGDRVSERTCEIQASSLCDDGLVSVCDSTFPEGRLILRDHFCPDVGWVGFEALRQAEGQPTVRFWTEDLRRDGVLIPLNLPDDETND